jgi:purine nucleosidase
VTKLLLDVDTGIDDSIALLYLLGSPEAEILGISCTAGNVSARQVAVNNLAWLELCGAPPIEVCLGSEIPLIQPLKTSPETHGPQGIGWAELPPPTRQISPRHAINLWSDIARSHPGEVTGLVTGPLTNLALAVRADPELPRLLHRLIVMGGSFDHPGNTTPTAEWNIAVDPDAAKIVFDAFSGLPPERRPIICGLNVTETIMLEPAHLVRLAEAAGSTPVEPPGPDEPIGTRSRASQALVRHVSDAMRFYFEFHREWGWGWFAHLHDPFAAAVALDPEWAELRAATVDVELAGSLTRGTTIADWTGKWGREPNAWVAIRTDPARFFDQLIERVGALSRRIQDSAPADGTAD